MSKRYTFNSKELEALQLAIATQLAVLEAQTQHADVSLPQTRKTLVTLSIKLLPF